MIEQASGGYIRLHRKLVENPVWTALGPPVLKVMLAFLLKANWKPGRWYADEQEIEVPRGSFITSYRKMAEFCQLSVKQTRSAFAHLENLQFAAYYRAPKWTKVTILNYDAYQASGDDEGTVESSLRARSGQDGGRIRATIEEVNKGRKNTPRPPKGDLNGIPHNPDELPFAAELDPIPDESGNGNNGCSAGAQKGNGHVQKSATAIQEIARRIHARHPNNHLRRDCSVEQVEKKLAAIVKRKRVPADGQAAFLEQIDRNHAAMCASELWRKDDGQFVKGLEGWLAPTKERYLASPVVITANASEQRYVL